MNRTAVVLATATVVAGGVAPSASLAATPKPQILTITADATALKLSTKVISARPGQFTLRLKNPSPARHRIAIRGGDMTFAKVGNVVGKGGVSTVTVTLKSGKTYLFFCQVPGHETVGEKGKITVK